MAKTKRISVNAFEKAMKETYAPTVAFEWNGNDVIVTKTLDIGNMMQFVSNVVTGCFDSETGAYMPEVKDFFVKFNILEMYANFTMPKNVNTRYELIYCTDAVENVLNYINHVQFNEIMTAIDKKIDALVDSNASFMASKMIEMASAFEALQNKTSEIFENITTDDINAIAGAVKNGTLDADSLVKAYMSQKDDE